MGLGMNEVRQRQALEETKANLDARRNTYFLTATCTVRNACEKDDSEACRRLAHDAFEKALNAYDAAYEAAYRAALDAHTAAVEEKDAK